MGFDRKIPWVFRRWRKLFNLYFINSGHSNDDYFLQN